MNVRSTSPQPQYKPRAPQSPMVTQQRARPVSARTPPSPRPSSSGQQQGSRPVSAKVPSLQNAAPSEPPKEAFDVVTDEQAPEPTIQLEMPSAEVTSN